MDPSSIITQVEKPEDSHGLLVVNGNSPAAAASRQLFCCVRRVSRPTTAAASSKSVGVDGGDFHDVICSANINNNNNSFAVSSNDSSSHLNIEDSVYYRSIRDESVEPPLRLLEEAVDPSMNTLIIDLDETLVHSSFKPIQNADFIVPVDIDGVVHQVYVLKRPHVDKFLQRVGPLFECVLFTASLGKYADPVTDLLDKWNIFRYRLFRESCIPHNGTYVKDLSLLGRNLENTIIIDNSPASYAWHPENAVPISSWFDDEHDEQLLELIPLLETLAASANIKEVFRNFESQASSPTSSMA